MPTLSSGYRDGASESARRHDRMRAAELADRAAELADRAAQPDGGGAMTGCYMRVRINDLYATAPYYWFTWEVPHGADHPVPAGFGGFGRRDGRTTCVEEAALRPAIDWLTEAGVRVSLPDRVYRRVFGRPWEPCHGDMVT